MGDSEDNKLTSSEEEQVGLGGGLRHVFLKMIGAARNTQNEKKESKEGMYSSSTSEDDNIRDLNNNIVEEIKEVTTDSAQKQKVTARKPEFERGLITITDEQITTRYSDAIYSWNVKMLTALGVEISNCDSAAFATGDKALLCNRALEHLLKQTEDCQTKYLLELEGLLVEESNYNFVILKTLVDNALHTIVD